MEEKVPQGAWLSSGSGPQEVQLPSIYLPRIRLPASHAPTNPHQAVRSWRATGLSPPGQGERNLFRVLVAVQVE